MTNVERPKHTVRWMFVFLLLALAFYWIYSLSLQQRAVQQIPAQTDMKRDFLFQIADYDSKNQGGQRATMYFHYRYAPGIKTADIPDYRDVRAYAIHYMDTLDTSKNPYWETVTKGLCEGMQKKFSFEAISCQLQVQGDTRAGLPNEPGVHSSITTIGDIEPLSVVN